jgi:hypothetical protein
VIGQNGRFYLVTAAGYAMIGDLPRARGAWAQLKGDSPLASDPRGFFERLGYSAKFRDRAISHLRAAHLIAG